MGIASVLWLLKELMPQYEALFSPNKEMNSAPQCQTISSTFWSDLSPYAKRFIGHLLAVGGQTTLTKGFLIILFEELSNLGFSLGNVKAVFKDLKSGQIQLGIVLICVVPEDRKEKR